MEVEISRLFFYFWLADKAHNNRKRVGLEKVLYSKRVAGTYNQAENFFFGSLYPAVSCVFRKFGSFPFFILLIFFNSQNFVIAITY